MTDNELNINTVYMFAFRYALGRRTFAPNIVIDFLSARLSKLTDYTIKQIITEIDDCGDYGDECDCARWIDFRSSLEDELKYRESRKILDAEPIFTRSEAEEKITWVKECKENTTKFKDSIRETIENQLKSADNVNHPSHYCDGKIEVIDFIEDKNLNYHLGNVIKYVSRAGKKCPDKEIEDLKKARWYLDRYIEKLEEENEEDC